MSKIGNLPNASAGTFNIDYLPQFLQIDDPESAVAITSLNIVYAGKTIINLGNLAQIQTLFKLENGIIADGGNTTMASRLLLATGKMGGSTTVNVVNGAATTPPLYVNSLGLSPDGMVRNVVITTVIQESNLSFSGFDVIFFLPTNVDYCLVTFANGFVEQMTTEELAGLYAANNESESDGLVNGFVVVNGYRADSDTQISRIEIFASAGGNVNVVTCGWQPTR